MPGQTQDLHDSFELVRHNHIEALSLDMTYYRHRDTGAEHYHMSAPNNENVFLVALRTVPEDSTGVAHILEHTALCGSERFPVRDPFFMMTRRSLNTFMNAFTSSDWTAYPFASQNRKDFQNLLEVYLDAVFFSRLDPLDFAQEGHRMEFSQAQNPDSDLVFKGVVYNEMKGAMSSVTSTLWQTLSHHLFPTTTYHYNSGGDPEHIPDLSYEQLKQFYQSHYHPSNAIFMTFGDIPAAELQAEFHERALHRFSNLEHEIRVPRERRYPTPQRVNTTYAYDDGEDTRQRTHIVMAWLVGDSTNLEQLLEAQLLSSVLLDNSASPLQLKLETSKLGQSPSPLCGLEDSLRELVFVCGLEGSEPEHTEMFEQDVLNTLIDLAKNGVEQERLESVLHQLELHQREIGGDSYPYGLQLILTALASATHYSDPAPVLDLDPVLNKLRKQIEDPDYIKSLVTRLLLENNHRVTLCMAPDTELSANRAAAEVARLAAFSAAMNDTEKQQILSLTRQLKERQEQEDDTDLLPTVGLADVDPDIPDLTAQSATFGSLHCTQYAQGTNGIVYQQLITCLPQLSQTQLNLLPHYTGSLTEVGIASSDYLATQERQAAVCGSINAFTSIRGGVNSAQEVSAFLVLSSKALQKNQEAQTQLMLDTTNATRFDEHARLRELVSQSRARREQGITSNGHGLVMTAAAAGYSPVAALSHKLSGLAGIRSVKELDKRLDDASALESYATDLAQIHQAMQGARQQLLQITEPHNVDTLVSATSPLWEGLPAPGSRSDLALAETMTHSREVWITSTQVNFCALAFPTVAPEHPDAAPLTVLGGYLRNGFLHRAIREQGGAYGGGATQDSGNASFRFYSYRDPRLVETVNDFNASLAWLMNSAHKVESLEEAILGVIASLDRPSSPSGEAKQHFHNNLFARTHEHRRLFRQRILDVTVEDLRRVTEQYLLDAEGSTAILTDVETASEVDSWIQERQLVKHIL